ncbi:MAG TPA: polymer-forming cytoskeletal protein [Pyrinomonadaceae bacterium]|jgi:cytoskeletal protein CcmA (bactofilin family)|nr:polymer-forming cytoskeletal protein [Pyrinomonadaceae bacterium]
MLRIGKNAKDQEEHDHSQKPEVPDYSAKSYASYQPVNEAKPAVEPSAPRGAMTESETLARDIKEGTLSGFVGGGTVVTGEANFKAMMRVDGHLSGRVSSSSGTLIVGANGKVDANIEVAVAVIHGTINGDIIASQRLELGRAAKVNGNIQTPSLIIEQGAVFEGTCKMLQMTAAADKAKNNNKKEEPLDTSRMKPIPADAGAKTTDIPAVSNVVS